MYKRLKRKIVRGEPLTFHGSYKRKIKVFSQEVQWIAK